MLSVCCPEYEVACTAASTAKQKESAPWCMTLQRSRIWGRVGWATNAIYSTLTAMVDEGSTKYQGLPVVWFPKSVIAEAAGVCINTAAKSLDKLVILGLLLKVPPKELPRFRFSKGAPPTAYAIVEVTEAVVLDVVTRVRNEWPIKD